ncbi:MAG: hypothetical protein E7566_07365 [Ruminococcaceae bacterium]|nr:hypothetical protein [Oscillospiraceae bacterium]
MKTRRILALLMAVLMLIGCLAACGGKGDDKGSKDDNGTTTTVAGGSNGGEETAVTDWTADIAKLGAAIQQEAGGNTISLKVWGPEAAQDVFKKQTADFAELFKDYADIQIEVKVQGEDTATTAVQNDPESAADVFGFASDHLELLYSANLAEVIFPDDVKNNNTEPSIKGAQKNGTLYAYPSTDNSYILAYDKSVLNEDQVKTFEGLLDACKAAGKTFVMDAKNGYFNCTFLFTGGWAIDGFEANGETQKFNDYDIDQVTKTVKAYADVLNGAGTTFVASASGTAIDGFKKGTTAAGIVGSWDINSVEEALGENAGYAVIPSINVDGTDVPSKNMFGYKYLGVNKVTKYPLTSQILANYLTNYDCQLYRAQEISWTPVNLEAQQHEDVLSSASINVFVEQSKNAVVQTEVAKTFWDPLAALGTYMLTAGNDTSEAALKTQIEMCLVNIKDE